VPTAETHEVGLVAVELKAVLEEPRGGPFVGCCGLAGCGAVRFAASGDAAVIDIELERGEGGGVGSVQKRKEGCSVKSREDGGKRGALRGTKGKIGRVMGVVVEGERGGAGGEEGRDPVDEARWEAIEAEEMDKAGGAEVVEEALDIEEYCSGYAVGGNAGVDKVMQVTRAIDSATEVPAAKLERREDIEAVEVWHDTLGDDLFKEFADAFQEANGSVCFRGWIVQLIRLRDHDNLGASPRVYTEQETCGKEGSESRRWRGKSPLQ
jgi:hypothetical protein